MKYPAELYTLSQSQKVSYLTSPKINSARHHFKIICSMDIAILSVQGDIPAGYMIIKNNIFSLDSRFLGGKLPDQSIL